MVSMSRDRKADICLRDTDDTVPDNSLAADSSLRGIKRKSNISLQNVEDCRIDQNVTASNNSDPDTRLVEDEFNQDEEDKTEEDSDVPIDRGWAWVIVGACFGMHVLVLGGLKSFGVLFLELRDRYGVTARELGMMQGIAMTMMLGLGLAANMLAIRFTCQRVVFCGGILSSLGFILSAYVPAFDLLFLTYSTITGLGFALSYSPCIVMVGLHFKKRRSLANGISLSGSGVGSFILPIIIRWMLNEYGLSGCLLLLGGLMLNVCVCALLFRPFNSYSPKKAPYRKHQMVVKENVTGVESVTDDKQEATLLTTYDVNSRMKIDNNQHPHDMRQDERQLLGNDSWRKNHSEFASSEYIPFSSLQSIPKEEIKHLSSSLCAGLKCFKRKNNAGKLGHRKKPKLFNWSLLGNPLFLIYACSCGLGNFAYPNIFFMLPAHAESNGLDRDSAAYLVAIIGITDLIGRLFFGWFSDLKLVPRRYGFVGCMAISGVLNMAVPAMTTFVTMVIYAALYGLFAGSYMALISVMLADALGVEKLSSAYGLVMLVMAFGLLPGPLICGGIRDATLKWDYSFVLCGILALIGSIPPLFEPCAKRFVDAREERKHKNTSV